MTIGRPPPHRAARSKRERRNRRGSRNQPRAAHRVAVRVFSPDSSGAGGEPALVDFPRRRPAVKIATNTPAATNPMRTQTHHARPPPEPLVPGVVCVTCALTDVEFVIDVVTAGFVPVCPSAVPVADWVLLVRSPVALETAPATAFAALLAEPDPQPLTPAVAMPSASTGTTIGRRAVTLTTVAPFIAG